LGSGNLGVANDVTRGDVTSVIPIKRVTSEL
jgi:hypothetical protein